MKKLFIIALTITLLLTSVLSGCTSKKEDNQINNNTEDISYQYKENKIELPEELSEVASISIEENKIFLVGKNAEETNTFIWKKEDSGQWEKQLDISAFLNKKGTSYAENVYTSISKSGLVAITVMEENEEKLFLLNSDGTIIQEKNIEISSFGDDTPTTHKILDDNTILFSSVNGKFYLYQIDREKVTALNAENEYNYAVNFLDNELYLFTTNGLKMIDTKTLEEIENKKLVEQVQNKLEENLSLSVGIDVVEEDGEKKIYFADQNEITKLDGKDEVKLVDGTRTILGDNNYFIQGIYHQGDDIFAVVLNDEKETSELYEYHYDSELKKAEKQLKIYILEEDIDELEQIINAYQRKYPDVNITIETGLYGDSITKSDAIKQLNTEIASGNGPDIIAMDGMDVDNYIEKNILVDISDCIEQVNMEEELFLNIADTYKNGEKEYAVPMRFSPMYIASTEQDIPSNSAQIADYLKTLSGKEQSKSVFHNYSYDQMVSILYRTNLSSRNKESLLQDNNLENFYMEIKELYEMVDMSEVAKEEKKQLKYITNTLIGYNDFELVASNEISTAVDYVTSANSVYIAECLQKEEKIFYRYLENENGEYYYAPSLIMGINAKSNYIEEAKNFITYALSAESQKNAVWNGIPVNKTALKEILSGLEEKKYKTETDPHSTSAHKGESVTITLTPFTEEEIKKLLNDYENFKIPVQDDCNIRNIIMEQADDLVMQKITIDEAVTNTKNSISIYLNE